MTVTDMTVGGSVPTAHGQELRRWLHDGEVYLNVSDLIYLADCSRERFKVEGNPHASDAMERLTFVLSMLAIVVSV